MKSGGKSAYDVLGVSPHASAEVIDAAYRALIRKYHPDQPNGDARRAAHLNRAYAILRNPSSRSMYDLSLQEKTRLHPQVRLRMRPAADRRRITVWSVASAAVFAVGAAGVATFSIVQAPASEPWEHAIQPDRQEIEARLRALKSDPDLSRAQMEVVRSEQALQREIDVASKALTSDDTVQEQNPIIWNGQHQPGSADPLEAAEEDLSKREEAAVPRNPSVAAARRLAASAAAQRWADCVGTGSAQNRRFAPALRRSPFEGCLVAEADARSAIELAIKAAHGRVDPVQVEHQMNRIRAAMLDVLP